MMVAGNNGSITIPEVKIYDPHRGEDILLRNVTLDTNYVCDNQGKVIYFDISEAKSHLGKQGKSLASLPLLTNLYIALNDLARENEIAAQVLLQLNNAWDRTGTTISTTGRITHSDSILGDVVYDDLNVPLEGNSIADLFGKHEDFFRCLLGIRDIDRLMEVAAGNDLTPFYWYPRGERRAMFGGGDFYYMHQHMPGLLMVFCDDESHPRRVLRGVSVEQ